MNHSEFPELKTQRLRSLSTPDGVITALAMDQRKSLRKMIAEARGVALDAIADEQLVEFKTAVASVLSPYASAVLLDPEYGLAAAHQRAPGCGLLLTYEADGFENPRPHRMLALMPQFSVRRLRDLGASAIKILLTYTPDGDPRANDEKHAMIERIGYECQALDMPFLLEPVVYDPEGLDPKGLEFCRQRPSLVVRTMEEFSKPVYCVDILKVEFPVYAPFVEGTAVSKSGPYAQSRTEARDWFQAADAAAGVPYIYLSAGINNAEFLSSLELAAEAGARYSGVLCGRANWQGGVAPYVRGGIPALTGWLSTEGAANMQRLNAALAGATPWSKRARLSTSAA